MLFKKLKRETAYKKRGFTLAETVLALAVISITSVASISLILAAQNATTSAAQKQQAQLFAADIVQCFRVSHSQTDFESNLEFALGKEISDITTIDLDNELTANVEIFDNNIIVTMEKDEKEIVQLSFTKGALVP